jgi:hypothetical protein
MVLALQECIDAQAYSKTILAKGMLVIYRAHFGIEGVKLEQSLTSNTIETYCKNVTIPCPVHKCPFNKSISLHEELRNNNWGH